MADGLRWRFPSFIREGMMTVQYVGCSASQLIRDYPRAVYRVVIRKERGDAPLYFVGALKWRDVVQRTIDGSGGVAGYPLGDNMANVLNTDDVATLDYLAGQNATTSTVADLVRQVQDSSRQVVVASIERRSPVGPGVAGIKELGQQKDEATEIARAEAERESVAGRLAQVADTVGFWGGIALAGAAAFFGYLFVREVVKNLKGQS